MAAYKHVASLRSLVESGRAPLFQVGLAAGAAVLLWLVLGPLAWGAGAWWPFDASRLVSDLDYRLGDAPVPADALGAWLAVAGALAVVAFAVAWRVLRRDEVMIQLDILQTGRRVEHERAVARTDALWDAAESAEVAGDDAGQLARLEEYAEAAALATLTADVRADRTARLRALAREAAATDPDRAMRFLELARKLHGAGRAASPTLARVLAADAAAFLAGVAATVVAVPVASLILLSVVGFVVFLVSSVIAFMKWLFKIVTGLIVLAVIVAAIASN